MYKAVVKVPGSCGELAQGLLKNTNFMITCPVNLFSRVSVVLDKNICGVSTNIKAEKTIKAVRKLLSCLQRNQFGVDINIDSQLMRGKGMASSTADITGAMAAVMLALGCRPDLQLITIIALEVEPTDGIFLPGVNYFDHIEGKTSQNFGEPPALDILVFTEQGEMDTLNFNKIKGLREKKKAKEKQLSRAVNYIKAGIKHKNKRFIGKGATISTIAHQQILYKPYLKDIIQIIDNVPAVYGVNTAHSGKLIGIIVDRKKEYKKLVYKIRKQVPHLNYWQRVSIISGGIRYIEGEKRNDPHTWRKYKTGSR